MLLIKSSKLSMPKSFSMSIIWKILTAMKNLYASWWFSWYMLSNIKCLPENFSLSRSSDLFWRFFRLTSTFCLSFLHLNFTITDSFFFKWWQACKLSGLISFPIKESAWQMFSLSSSSLIDEGTLIAVSCNG